MDLSINRHRLSWWRQIGDVFPLGALPSGKPRKTMERSSMFNGTTHYFYGHFQIRKLSQFTRG